MILSLVLAIICSLLLRCYGETIGLKPRGALIVTLAGNHKLAEYFEWSCRTIGASAELFDMIVFHESNVKVAELKCASNVKMIDVGANGLSKLLIDTLMQGSTSNESVRGRMSMMLNDILLHSPRYLVEIKPLLGTMFQKYLTPYSHWSYTDPDIIWANLADWVEVKDLERFHIVTYAKNMDAGRLFLRGQLAIHQNIPIINNIWKKLSYFSMSTFPERLGNAFRMLQEKRSSDEIFAKNFESAEGWYSQLVFKSNITVKIIGRGFDDFYRHPVVLNNGHLTRCNLDGNLTGCIDGLLQQKEGSVVSVHTLPQIQMLPARAYHDANQCKMFWLPVPTRYCIALPVYEKQALLQKDSKQRVKLQRVGESIFENGTWWINDEEMARRQVPESAAFFHFRHWDDFISKSISTTWNLPSSSSSGDPGNVDCMVLYLRSDGAMAFEACAGVKLREGRGDQVLLIQAPRQGASVAKTLIQQRKEAEVGPPERGSARNKGKGKKHLRGQGEGDKKMGRRDKGNRSSHRNVQSSQHNQHKH